VEENPAHAFLGDRQHTSGPRTATVNHNNGTGTNAGTLLGKEDQSAMRQAQLERTVKGLLSRLEAANQHLAHAKIEAEKKSRLVVKYENYYRELKRSVEKREQERGGASTNAGTATAVVGTNAVTDVGSSKADNTNAIVPDRLSDINKNGATYPSVIAPHMTTAASTATTITKHSNETISSHFGVPPSMPLNLPRVKVHSTTSTLEASLQRSAALEKKDRKK